MAVFLISVIPVSPRISAGPLDKLLHLCEYLVFSWLLVGLLRASGLRGRDYLVLAWIYATSYGLLIEVIQAMIPWRSGDLVDAVANGVGAALGVWLGRRNSRDIYLFRRRSTRAKKENVPI